MGYALLGHHRRGARGRHGVMFYLAIYPAMTPGTFGILVMR